MSRSRDLANLANNASGLETLTVSDITDLTATAAELNYVDGVGSALQTQINSKIGGSNPTITLGSNTTFPAGSVLQVKSSGATNVASTTDAGDVVNSGVELTIGTGNKAYINVTGWMYTAFSGSTSDRWVSIYKEVSGSDALLDEHQPGAWGETEPQFARGAISGSYLDNTTGTVRYKLKVKTRGTAGTIHYYTIVTVFEVKG
tara:strand:- start:509 stop:1117 length:609 start_codon:yes stop_codon:yes gene_type:complete